VKKIMSILLALGVILGLTLAAAPVAADEVMDGVECPTDCSGFPVIDGLGPPDFCASGVSDYIIGDSFLLGTGITLPVTLIVGTDSLSVTFPPGTDLSDVGANDIWVWDDWSGWGAFVTDPTDITITDNYLEFVIPVALWSNLRADEEIDIWVFDVINPPTAGDYCLFVDYKLACCEPVVFDCVEYTVAPAKSTVDFVFDFGTTYLDIAEGFIPPFKACGQDGYGTDTAGVGWVTNFDIILRADPVGCNPPCAVPTAFWFEVTKCPAGEVIYLDIPGAVGTPWTLDEDNVTDEDKFDLMAVWPGWPPPDQAIPAAIHFSSPGDYEITFYIKCPADCGVGELIIDEPLPATAYQYKDAWKCQFEPKWNLWSLPLYPFDTDIDSIFAAMDRPDQLMSVWYFSQCADPDPNEGVWDSEAYDAADGTFTPGDMKIQAGKAYWVRMLHPGDADYDAAAFPVSLWVWGTHAIMPEPPGIDPGYFNVCEGWNMVGFKPEWDLTASPDAPLPELDSAYLWNFNKGTVVDVNYGLIYQWVTGIPGDWATHLPGTLSMQPCEGYWIPFDGDLQIYPKA
jgi:hypothetical protein